MTGFGEKSEGVPTPPF